MLEYETSGTNAIWSPYPTKTLLHPGLYMSLQLSPLSMLKPPPPPKKTTSLRPKPQFPIPLLLIPTEDTYKKGIYKYNVCVINDSICGYELHY